MGETTTQRSADIAELVKALVAAQKDMKPPKKAHSAKATETRSYKYADLSDVIEIAKEPLCKNGLAHSQTLRCNDGHMVLVTTLFHTSGQWLASEYPLANYDRPQETGSAMTYARRYSLTAMLGIAAEDDDDGQTAQHAEPKQEQAPISGDAAAIVFLASEIEQFGGNAEEIIRKASAFPGKDGKEQSFTDPTKVRSAKWLASTRGRLEKEMHNLHAIHEPGAAEAAAALT